MESVCIRGCSDWRLNDAMRELEQTITKRFDPPYVQRAFGSELPLIREGAEGPVEPGCAPMWHAAIREMRAWLREPRRAYVLIGHDGGERDLGCAAYYDDYGENYVAPLPIPKRDERALHWYNLNLAREHLQLEARCFGYDLRVICLIDHHDGGLELVTRAEVAAVRPHIITVDEVCNLIDT